MFLQVSNHFRINHVYLYSGHVFIAIFHIWDIHHLKRHTEEEYCSEDSGGIDGCG